MIWASFFKTIRSKMSILLGLARHLSVEPVALCYFVTMVFSNCLGTSLLVYKACDPTGSANVQQRVGAACPDEAAAQHVVAPINAWKSLVQQLVPIVIAMVAGTWSDRAGRNRRPLIAWPVAGQIAADVLSLCCVIRWSVSPAVTAAVQTVALTVTGGSPLIFTGINTYTADTTPEQWRTIKYGLVNSSMTLGCILGMVVYGTVSANTGFVTAYLVSIGLGLVTMALTFVFVKGKGTSAAADAVVADPHENSLCQELVDVVNPVSVFRKCYNVLSKQRPGHSTAILCLAVLACAPLTCVPLEGEMTLMYLFLRYKFHWNEVDFSIFNIYLMTIICIGTIFALSILNHALRMDDALIGAMASAFDVLAAIAFFLASQSWHLYYICPLEIFRGAALALTSSIASKNVKPEELGAMYSMKLLTESTMKGAFTPFYNYVYNYTLETMPSAFFLISAALTAPLVVIFGIIYYLNRSSDLNSQQQT